MWLLKVQPIPLGVTFSNAVSKAQSSKLERLFSLKMWQKRPSSFELWAFENVTTSGIGCTCGVFSVDFFFFWIFSNVLCSKWHTLFLLLGSNLLAYYDLAVNLDIKVSKTLSHWILLLASFRFCETQYLHFTTCVFGHSAITPFLGRSQTCL